ncbi:MAG TPA: pitrilysin family protein [Blastocatellia bacterium]|nr:pitrilysin family protein [Blastocatellia bacterium]
MMFRLIGIILALALTAPGLAGAANDPNAVATVLIPNSSAIVSFRVLFNIGSASDPKGKEGVAALTAAMLAKGGSRKMTYEQIVQAMFPMAAGFNWQVDKEMTVFIGQTHVNNLQKYYQIIAEMLLNPGWREDDFTRIREESVNFLKVTLRLNNDEELGKEALYNFIYEGHAYGHHNVGTIESLQKLTLEDVKNFYRDNYTRANLVIGLAGGYPKGFVEKVEGDFAARLAAGKPAKNGLPQPAKINKLEMQVIKKDARGTAISFGFPIPVTRADADWPALLLVQTYLGQHRSTNSYLLQAMRQKRGLNYGSYAYIEYFPRGMFQFQVDPNLARRQQIFQVWVRPVEPQNGLFALRIALYELRKLVDNGMSQQDFETTQQFLTKFINVLTNTQDAQLGYALDSRFYGIPNFNEHVRSILTRLTLKDVNRVIKQYLQADNVKIVVVAKDADGFAGAALANKPSPVSYPSPMPKEILEEDKVIENYRLGFDPKRVAVVPVEQVFQK